MPRRSHPRAAAVLAIALAAWPPLAALGTGGALADAVEVLEGRLPSGRTLATAVWTGEKAYVFGGWNGLKDLLEVVEFDPGTGLARTMMASLPRGSSDAAAVWDPRDRPEADCAGGCAYLFGGRAPGAETVLRYNPATDTVGVMAASLPGPLLGAAAFFDGKYAYVLGGCDRAINRCAWDPVQSDRVFRYDPITDRLTLLDERMPSPRMWGAAAWDPRDLPATGCAGGCAYYLAGGSMRPVDEILRFHPASGEWSVMKSRLDRGSFNPAAVTDPRYVFAIGGFKNFGADGGELDEIQRFDPIRDEVVTMAARLPTGLVAPAAVYAGSGNVLAFGGDHHSVRQTRILQYNLAPGAPRDVQATGGPEPGLIRLTWEAPEANTYSNPDLSYHVHRAGPDGKESPVAVLHGERVYTDEVPPLLEGAAPGVSVPDALQVYRYRVSASNDAGEGPRSLEACASATPWVQIPERPWVAPCDVLHGWKQQTLLNATVPFPPSTGQGAPADAIQYAPGPGGVGFLTLGGPAEPLTLRVAGPDAPFAAPLPRAGQAPGREAATLDVRAYYRYDPREVECSAAIEERCLTHAPLDRGEPGWAAAHGSSAVVVVQLTVLDGGGTALAKQVVTLPLVGQAIPVAKR